MKHVLPLEHLTALNQAYLSAQESGFTNTADALREILRGLSDGSTVDLNTGCAIYQEKSSMLAEHDLHLTGC